MMSEIIDSWVMPGVQGGPLMHVIAAKAVAFKENLTQEFYDYTAQVIKNAQALANALMGYGFTIISGGTDNHCMLIDLRNKGISGKQGDEALDKAGITCNKNMVPYDDKPALVTSGIRLGTPAITTRGMNEQDMATIAGFINTVIDNHQNEAVLADVKNRVKEFCGQFPVVAKQS